MLKAFVMEIILFWHFFIAQPSWAHKYKEKQKKIKKKERLNRIRSLRIHRVGSFCLNLEQIAS